MALVGAVRSFGKMSREIVLMVENSVDRRISNLHASVLHAKVGPFGHPYEEPGLYHTCKHTETG